MLDISTAKDKKGIKTISTHQNDFSIPFSAIYHIADLPLTTFTFPIDELTVKLIVLLGVIQNFDFNLDCGE